MPKKLSGTSCLSRALPRALQPVWITDAVLADAFRRFSHNAKRHSSNVPGPLEARRRSSKRRNTSLAHAGGAAAIDPAIIFPRRSRDTWWRKEPEPDAILSQGVLHRWLFPSPEPPPVPELPPALGLWRDGLRQVPAPDQQATPKSAQASLRSDLLLCSCTKDIHRLLAKRSIDLRQTPVTKLFIESLLLRWTPAKIADFLTDPDLNPPGTNHHVRMMAFLRKFPAQIHSPWRKVEERNTILQALCRAINLGLLVPRDIENIIAALPQIEISGPSEISIVPGETDVLVMTYSLLRSLRNSRVLSMKDLSLDFRNTLLSKVTKALPSPASLQLLGILSEATSEHCDPAAADMITAWLLGTSERKDSSALEAIGDYLLTLPDSSLARLLSVVTETLFLTTRNDPRRLVAFESWAEILESSHLSIRAPSLGRTGVECIRRGFSPQRTPTEAALMSYWLQHTLQAHHTHRTGTELLSLDLDLQCQVRRAWAVGSNVHALDWLVEMNQVLQSLPIRNRRSVLLKLTHSLKDLLLANASSQPASLATADWCLRACETLADDAFYEVAKRHFKHELTRFCESITSDLMQFKNTVRALIDQGDMAKLKVIPRVIKHNRVFRLGLAQHNRERHDWREVLITDNVALVRSKPYHPQTNLHKALPPDGAVRLPPPQRLIDVIDHIAVSFATNPHESAQTAYNRVRQCWRFLRGHRVPAGPVIARCLWHAGIARHGSEGTSQARLRWVSERVRRTEGKLIARLLMSNSAFRAHRMEVIESVRRTCEDAEEDKSHRASNLLREPRPGISPPRPEKQAKSTLQKPGRLDIQNQASLATIIDWIAQPKKHDLQPAELAALEALANSSVPREQTEASLEAQKASLERLLKSQDRRTGKAEQKRFPRLRQTNEMVQ